MPELGMPSCHKSVLRVRWNNGSQWGGLDYNDHGWIVLTKVSENQSFGVAGLEQERGRAGMRMAGSYGSFTRLHTDGVDRVTKTHTHTHTSSFWCPCCRRNHDTSKTNNTYELSQLFFFFSELVKCWVVLRKIIHATEWLTIDNRQYLVSEAHFSFVWKILSWPNLLLHLQEIRVFIVSMEKKEKCYCH